MSQNKLWSIEIGFYPGILFGLRSYNEPTQTAHVLYMPFVDLALTFYRDENDGNPWTVEMLNKSTPKSLRYTDGIGINPGESFDKAEHVQAAFEMFSEPEPLSGEEQLLANDLNDAKKLKSLHDSLITANYAVPEDDQAAFEKKIDNISKIFHNDLESGKFKGDDDEARDEYFKRIGEAFGWEDVDVLDEKALGEARGQMKHFFNYTQGEDYGIRIGGGGLFKFDSQFKDMTEDSGYVNFSLFNNSKIPDVGKIPDEIYMELESNPITASMVKSRNFGGGIGVKREFTYDEALIDSYLAENYPEIREQYESGEITIDQVIEGLGSQATHTNITKDKSDDTQSKAVSLDSTPIENSDIFTAEEKTSLINVDYEEEEVKEENVEGFYRDGKFYPYAKVDAGDKDEITTEGLVEKDQGAQINQEGSQASKTEINQNEVDPNTGETYFDLRGEGAFKESFLDKMGGLSSLIGLATGAIGLGAALKDVDIPKDPKLGPAFQQRLAESKRMAQQGLTPSELAKAHNDLDSSYATGIDNIVRGSAGNRAQFMAGLGGLDVARQSALMDIAVADAQMQRQNQEKYDSMMIMNEQYEAARQAKYQDAKFQQDTARQAAGAALAGSSISMVADAIASRQTNRYNKMKTEQLLMQMGYKATKDGKSGQDKVGDGVQTSFSIFDNNDESPDFNLLDADDQAVNTDVSNQPKNKNTGNNLLNTSPLNTSSGLINTDNEIDLGTQMYDIFNTGH